jgi:hypothetical protein
MDTVEGMSEMIFSYLKLAGLASGPNNQEGDHILRKQKLAGQPFQLSRKPPTGNN